MKLSDEIVTEFKELYAKKFGVQIPHNIAELELISLAELVKATQPFETRENEDEDEQ